MMRNEYDYIITPGHGFLVVPMADLKEIGFVSTEYSFHNGDTAWLEEDCDMSAFLWIYEKQHGKPVIKSQFSDHDVSRAGKSYFKAGDKSSTYDDVREEWLTKL